VAGFNKVWAYTVLRSTPKPAVLYDFGHEGRASVDGLNGFGDGSAAPDNVMPPPRLHRSTTNGGA
jgi:hypothetical protein